MWILGGHKRSVCNKRTVKNRGMAAITPSWEHPKKSSHLPIPRVRARPYWENSWLTEWQKSLRWHTGRTGWKSALCNWTGTCLLRYLGKLFMRRCLTWGSAKKLPSCYRVLQDLAYCKSLPSKHAGTREQTLSFEISLQNTLLTKCQCQLAKENCFTGPDPFSKNRQTCGFRMRRP